MKSVLITSYFFYPEINPRAFRSFELAKELAKRGYKVDVVLPEINFDYEAIEKDHNITIHLIKPGFFLNKSPKDLNSILGAKELQKSVILSVMKWLISCIYIGGKTFEYAFTLSSFLKKLTHSYDIVISISFPISVHLGTRWYLNQLNKKIISIADSGDPFSFSPEIKPKCFYFQAIEKYILKSFTYVTIPTISAFDSYTYLKDKNAIKIIPQSFNTAKIKTKIYQKNKIPIFAYAGIFYKNIRNPKILFDFLVELHDKEFKFIIYTNTNNPTNMEIIDNYKEILKEKLEIHSLIPREECIYELSGMDFIINQNNTNPEQKPSKLIDYMLTKRPIFEFDQNMLNKDLFLKFLNRDFQNQTSYDEILKGYTIENVTNQFEVLMS